MTPPVNPFELNTPGLIPQETLRRQLRAIEDMSTQHVISRPRSFQHTEDNGTHQRQSPYSRALWYRNREKNAVAPPDTQNSHSYSSAIQSSSSSQLTAAPNIVRTPLSSLLPSVTDLNLRLSLAQSLRAIKHRLPNPHASLLSQVQTSSYGPKLAIETENEKERCIRTLRAQRSRLEKQLERRFWKPKLGKESISDKLVLVGHSASEMAFYPIRIGNISSNHSSEQLLQSIAKIISISEFSIVRELLELDGSRTICIGLRWVEDALEIWSCLHGIKFGNQLLEVHPVTGIIGEINVPISKIRVSRPIPDRVAAIHRTLRREMILSKDPLKSPRVETGRQLLEDLKMIYYLAGCSSADQASKPVQRTKLISYLHVAITPHLLPSPNLPPSSTSTAVIHRHPPLEPRSTTAISDQMAKRARSTETTILPSYYSALQTNPSSFTPQPPPSNLAFGHLQPVMLSKERRRKCRSILSHVEVLRSCWKEIQLPEFTPPNEGSDLDRTFKAYWDWQDGSLEAFEKFRQENGEKYDYEMFIHLFTDPCITPGLYGKKLVGVTRLFEARYLRIK